MKKSKIPSHTKISTPATHRKTSSKVQSIYTPFRIDWKHQPLKNICNQQPDFYRNMKNELNNIRNDVEKLINKDRPEASKSKTKLITSPSVSRRSKSHSQDISGISHITSPKTFNTSKKDLIELMESLPKGECKFQLLESKMNSLQLFNRQILDKLSCLQYNFKYSKGEEIQKSHSTNNYQKPQKPQMPENKQIEQMGSYQENTSRMEQKIEQFEKQMLKLQDIIMKMEEGNIQLSNTNEMLKKKLATNQQKLQKMSFKYSQKKKNYEMDAVNHQQEIQTYEIAIKELQYQKENLEDQFKNYRHMLQQSQEKFDKQKDLLTKQIQRLQQQVINIKNSNQLQGSKSNNESQQSNQRSSKSTIDVTKFQQAISIFQNENKQLMENIKVIQEDNNQLQKKISQLMIQLRKQKQSKNHQTIVPQMQIQNLQEKIAQLKYELLKETQAKNKLQQSLQNQKIPVESQFNCTVYVQTLQKEINRLQLKSQELQGEILQKGKTITTLQQKIQDLQTNGIKDLGKQFQDKLNQLYDQNYTQKNRIAFLESRLDEANQKKQSLQEAVRVYQSIQQNLEKDSKKYIRLNEKQDYEFEISRLKGQNQKLKDKHQVQIMKLQNQIDKLKANVQINTPSDLNLIFKNQLKQISELRQEIKKKNEKIQRLQQNIKENQSCIQDLNDKINSLSIQDYQQKKQQSQDSLRRQLYNLRNRMQMQKAQLKAKDKQLQTKQQFIRGALLGKIYSQQDKANIDHLLQQYQRIVVPSFTTL